MSSLSAILKKRRKELGLTLAQVADAVGVTEATVQRWECGNIKTARYEKVAKLAELLGVSPARIMGWEQPDSPSAPPLPSNLVPLQPMQLIPLLGQIACGSPILAAENIEEYIDLPRHIKADYALTCKGDSMIGAGIQDGDVVYIRKQEEVENGQIAAVMVGDEDATLKRFYFDGTVVQLVAENSRYSPQFFVEEDAALIHVIGLAVAFTHAIRHYS